MVGHFRPFNSLLSFEALGYRNYYDKLQGRRRSDWAASSIPLEASRAR